VIPYFPSVLFEIGDYPIHAFGILVAAAVVLGDRWVVRQGVRMGLDAQDVRFVNVRIVIGGFIVSHLVAVLAYHPEQILESPWVLLSFWSGLSSFGGFLGAALTFVWLMRREKLPALPFADAIALGLAPAWIVGRIGCFTAHDHPGRKTDFFLAVAYPNGARHDLGLYEAIATVFIAAALYAFARRRRGPGAIIGLFATVYAPVRFALDFLRATDVVRPDPRYFGLTPAQWACIACLAVGLGLLRRALGQPPYAGPEPAGVGRPLAPEPGP